MQHCQKPVLLGCYWLRTPVRQRVPCCAVGMLGSRMNTGDFVLVHFCADGCGMLGPALKAGKVTGPLSPPRKSIVSGLNFAKPSGSRKGSRWVQSLKDKNSTRGVSWGKHRG